MNYFERRYKLKGLNTSPEERKIIDSTPEVVETLSAEGNYRLCIGTKNFYTHRVDPHYAATHADSFESGWIFVTTRSKEYPIELSFPFCLFDHKSLEVAEDLRKQLMKLPKHHQDALLEGNDWDPL
jgi:hypothetical protein